jgi:hypothetical protein
MAISVAPLTTTVMNAVENSYVGIASGINNAVTRTAGLLAIAVLGLVMSHTFKSNLDRCLTTVNISVEVKREIGSQYLKLAGIEIPPNVDSATQTAARHAVQESFVAAFPAANAHRYLTCASQRIDCMFCDTQCGITVMTPFD